MLYTKGLTHEDCGEKTAYEVFKEKRNALGNLWAKIFVDYKKQGLPVWFKSLEEAYYMYANNFPQVNKPLVLGSYFRENGDEVILEYNDILPHDRTIGQVRFTIKTVTENGVQEKIYRAKAGKICHEYVDYLVRKGIYPSLDCPPTEKLIVNCFSEWTTNRIKAIQLELNNPGFKLKVDEDFEFIYSSRNAIAHHSFGSCQCDKELYDFYDNIKGAKAISLLNEDGYMVARAIYYTEIHDFDDDSKIYRGIERIYGYSDEYKLMLLHKAINDGLVDIFKTIDAGAYDTRLWRKIMPDGSEIKLDDARLYVNLFHEYDDDDPVAWGDSFRWYSPNDEKIYNFEIEDGIECNNYDRDFTFSDIRGWWNEYSQCYQSNDETQYEVYYRGEYISVTYDERSEYFYKIGCTWYEKDSLNYSDYDDRYYLDDDSTWCSRISDYVGNDNLVEVYTDYENDEYEHMPDGHPDIVECTGGYYIFKDDAIYFGSEVLDKNNAVIEIDGVDYKLVEI